MPPTSGASPQPEERCGGLGSRREAALRVRCFPLCCNLITPNLTQEVKPGPPMSLALMHTLVGRVIRHHDTSCPSSWAQSPSCRCCGSGLPVPYSETAHSMASLLVLRALLHGVHLLPRGGASTSRPGWVSLPDRWWGQGSAADACTLDCGLADVVARALQVPTRVLLARGRSFLVLRALLHEVHLLPRGGATTSRPGWVSLPDCGGIGGRTSPGEEMSAGFEC
jgi:hypothetical protein